MNKTINPELVLAGAKLAMPEFQWKDFGGWIGCEGVYDVSSEFNPLESDDDAMKLERALKKEGWDFFCGLNTLFAATQRYLQYDLQEDPSDTLLLLKCVSAMTGLPLYLE